MSLPPHIDLSRQKEGTETLVETTAGLWLLNLLDPTRLLVEVVSTDARFKRPVSIIGQVVGSRNPHASGRTEPGKLVIGWPFSIRFADAILFAEPIQSILIEGEGWKYELAS